MGDMGVEKRREMSMAVSNSPTCTNNATTSSALTNGPVGRIGISTHMHTHTHTLETHPGKNPALPSTHCLVLCLLES